MKAVIITLGTAVGLTIVVGLIVMYSGVFNVATNWKDPALLSWILETTRESSIESRAKHIQVPVLEGQERIDNGFRSYREMCAICHTPPGAVESPVNKGLNPRPTDLAKGSDHAIPDAEIFWVIKNGIRMTAMPAWGPTHSNEELWDIVAFVKTLPKLSPEDYRSMDQRLEAGHGHATESHEGGLSTKHSDSHDHNHEHE